MFIFFYFRCVLPATENRPMFRSHSTLLLQQLPLESVKCSDTEVVLATETTSTLLKDAEKNVKCPKDEMVLF